MKQRMPRLPQPGEWVRWRDPHAVKGRSWDKAFGDGPFLVVSVVDRSAHGMPNGIIVLTEQGVQEINETWLVLASQG